MVKTRQPGAKRSGSCSGSGVPGDREVDMKRLEASLAPAEVALLDEADFARHPFLVKGYIGPGALARQRGALPGRPPRRRRAPRGSPAPTSPTTTSSTSCAGRDFTPDGTIEAAEVRAGDPAPDGVGTLDAARGIEIGHVFQLGRKYTDAFALDALGADGKPIRITMGSYGIGVSRLVAAIAEQSARRAGASSGRARSPPPTCTWWSRARASRSRRRGGSGRELEAAGSGCSSTTARASPGVKFADAELLGVPTILVVGRGLADGVVELRDRASGDRSEVSVDTVVDTIVNLVRG